MSLEVCQQESKPSRAGVALLKDICIILATVHGSEERVFKARFEFG